VSGPPEGTTDLRALAERGPVHFMGIGGAGMNALAELLLRTGGRVTGCDVKRSETTRRLSERGVAVAEGHDPDHVVDATAVIVTAAVPVDHPELERARERGIPVLKRAEALGRVVNAGRVVAIAGTHGKTSTTAMTTELLAAAGMDPTGLVGGTVPRWEGNLRSGSDDLFVVEADEYDRSFHTLEPDIAVVTNLEADHLDIYGDLEGVREAFQTFLARLRPRGDAIVCADDRGASGLLAALPGVAITYGLSAGSMLRAVDVHTAAQGTRFRIVERGEPRDVLELGVPGAHNVRNALAASAVARALGAGWDAIARGLRSYEGVGRRFEWVGEAADVVVIDDYAHHPTEIEATIDAVRDALPGRRVVALFQPHLYTRTRDFLEGFGETLARADQLWVTEVFPAREEPIAGIDGELVADAARSAGSADVRYHASIDDVDQAVVGALRAGDVVVTMGAGSVGEVGARLIERLRRREEEPAVGNGSASGAGASHASRGSGAPDGARGGGKSDA